MANPLRDMSVIMQGLVAAAIAVVLVLVGIYVPVSPVAQEKDQVDRRLEEILREEEIIDRVKGDIEDRRNMEKADRRLPFDPLGNNGKADQQGKSG